MQHAFRIGDVEHPVALSRSAQAYRLQCGEGWLDIDLAADADGHHWLTVAGRRMPVLIATFGDEVFVHLDGETHALRYRHPLDRLAAQSGSAAEDSLFAPMPGSIVKVTVQVGDTVSRGQTLLVMESMKMETTLLAPRDGVVAEIRFEQAQSFDRDALLLSLEPA